MTTGSKVVLIVTGLAVFVILSITAATVLAARAAARAHVLALNEEWTCTRVRVTYATSGEPVRKCVQWTHKSTAP